MIQKLRKDEKKNDIYRVVVVAVLALAMLGTLLPGFVLVWQSKEQMNMVDVVPEEYYSPANLAVARNASANLGTYQKLQLITGRWESHMRQADSYDAQMEDYKAVELAKEQLDTLYQWGVYPTSLSSDYENWYSWEAEFCKVVDATFNTYAAYYWKLSFVKYDGSERHLLYMLEDGTIFLAEAWNEKGMDNRKISEAGINMSLGLTQIVKKGVSDENQNLEEYFAFTDIETADLKWMDLVQFQMQEKEYYVMQLYSDDCYLYSFQPVN